MRRRLDLAASLITRPPLIFLDEPTTGLDPRTRGQMWDTIRDLVANGCTVLLTTQYLDEADQLADRIAVIDHGAQGRRGHLRRAEGVGRALHAPAGPGRRRTRSRPPAEIADRLLGEQASLSPSHAASPCRCSAATRPSTSWSTLRERGIAIDSVNVQKPSLDEVFMALTGHDTGEPTTDQTTDTTSPELEAVR